MPYRETNVDERELRERLVRIRREHDELQERADRLAGEIANATRNPVLGTLVRALGGGMSDEELARARSEHERLDAELAALVSRERQAEGELAQVVAKRDAVTAQEANRLVALRAAEGPVGEQLRAMAAKRAEIMERVTAFDAVLDEQHRATIVLEELAQGAEDARATSSPVTMIARAVHNTAAVLAGDLVHTGDKEASAARRGSHIELACTRLHRFLDAFKQLAHTWHDPKPVELAVRQLAGMNTSTFDTASARTCLERLQSALVDERRQLAGTLAQLDASERELAERA